MSKALDESIEHWKRMLAYTNLEAFMDLEEPNGFHCALCQEYPGCIRCPVMAKTGSPSCQESPYPVARNAFYKIKYGGSLDALPEWQAAAQAEIDFLEGLKNDL